MPPAKGKRPNHTRPQTSPLSPEELAQLRGAEAMMEDAAAAAGTLPEVITKVAVAAKALLASGLTDRALGVLISDLMPNQRNGRPYPVDMVLLVLNTTAKLDQHLVKR